MSPAQASFDDADPDLVAASKDYAAAPREVQRMTPDQVMERFATYESFLDRLPPEAREPWVGAEVSGRGPTIHNRKRRR
jgi:hypothetical protein